MNAALVLVDWPMIQELVVKNYPIPIRREAKITVKASGIKYAITLVNPQPLFELASAFDNCYEWRMFDLNSVNSAQLEFGRFQLEFWDEDNMLAQVYADQLDYRVVQAE